MPTSSLSNEALVRHIKASSDARLSGELVNHHRAAVVQACYRYVKDHDTAQYLTQEVFMRVFSRIQEFNEQCAFSTWLHTIVHNRCVDHLRKDKQKMHREISKHIMETLAEEMDTDESNVLTIDMLEVWLDRLSGEDKWLLTMKYQQRWTIKQIEQVLNVSESVIKTRLHRAKAKLKKIRAQALAQNVIPPP